MKTTLTSSNDILQLVIDNKQEELKHTLEAFTPKHGDYSEVFQSILDWNGDGLLSTAVWHENIDMVKMLLDDFHAYVNPKNLSFSTPLHRAAYLNNIVMVRLLCSHGADIFAMDKQGKSPIDYAKLTEVREYLEGSIRDHIQSMRKSIVRLHESDKEFDILMLQQKKKFLNDQVINRSKRAVPIVIQGCKSSILDGVYRPREHFIHCDWPIYFKDNDHFILIFECNITEPLTAINEDQIDLPGKWIIQHLVELFIESNDISELKIQDRIEGFNHILDINLSHVIMETKIPSFPELRVEGSNGIIEFDLVDGKYKPLHGTSQIEIYTEDEIKAFNLSKVMKQQQHILPEEENVFIDDEYYESIEISP